MAFLQDLVDGYERLERLHLVGENWLPGRGISISEVLASRARGGSTRKGPTLSCPARKRPSSCDPKCRQCMLARVSLCWYKLRLRHEVPEPDVRLGDTSSMLVALRMLMASSDSCLKVCSLAYRKSSMAVHVMLYVLAHVDVARAPVERHLADRMRCPELRVGVVASSRRRGRVSVKM